MRKRRFSTMLADLHAFYWNAARMNGRDPETDPDVLKVQVHARRVRRVARIMRDPFFLAAERAGA